MNHPTINDRHGQNLGRLDELSRRSQAVIIREHTKTFGEL